VRTCFSVYRVLQVESNVDDGPDHLVPVPLRCILQALLHYIACEFVLGEVEKVSLHLSDEHRPVCLPPVLHHELYDVVAVAVLITSMHSVENED
jgi:hypothetical protein